MILLICIDGYKKILIIPNLIYLFINDPSEIILKYGHFLLKKHFLLLSMFIKRLYLLENCDTFFSGFFRGQKVQYFFSVKFCNIIYVFTITFNQFNVSLLKKVLISLKNWMCCLDHILWSSQLIIFNSTYQLITKKYIINFGMMQETAIAVSVFSVCFIHTVTPVWAVLLLALQRRTPCPASWTQCGPDEDKHTIHLF